MCGRCFEKSISSEVDTSTDPSISKKHGQTGLEFDQAWWINITSRHGGSASLRGWNIWATGNQSPCLACKNTDRLLGLCAKSSVSPSRGVAPATHPSRAKKDACRRCETLLYTIYSRGIRIPRWHDSNVNPRCGFARSFFFFAFHFTA